MTIEDLTTRTAAEFPRIRSDLESLVRIPSVSAPAFDPQHLEDSAAAVAQLFRDAGMPEVEVVRVTGPDGRPGAPAVLAHKPAPAGAPTVLLYAHHDVQPPGDPAGWTSSPFEPTERDGRLYGRGAADDKAGIMAHVGALRVLGDELGVGVTVFSEGEEEIGSPTFRTFLETYRDRLAADVIVVADSSNWKVGVPGLTTSLRGLVDCTVELSVLDHAVHSGMFGGPVLDALTLMSRLVATLHDDDGNVAVPGLVATDHADVDYPEADFRADAGVLDGVRLAGTGPLAARLWTKPAISVIGLDATSVDHSSNTVIPSARAKLSMRIAPGQDPAAAERALHDHLVASAPFGARVTVTPGETGQAFQAPEDSAAMQAARWAFTNAWGTEPVDLGVGGSIPFIADLAEVYPQAAILVTGVEDPDSRAHSENESVHLGELEKVVLAEALLLARLADRL
ncbi:dipeptidase [Oceanitalea stevensii]|uniref:Dipeptidase n=1 Tax=Oceanitalea stevensii TaxID=2763072 RepID=A0ABR8YZC6_9MICO|nr:dipeptidase [Oceanitalea stevensii]MBD8061138.1 dipeptidase [Oceanitalea stevensii]